jgi:hypothetical protein
LGIFHPWVWCGGEACPFDAERRGQPPAEAARYSGAGAAAQASRASRITPIAPRYYRRAGWDADFPVFPWGSGIFAP